MTSEPCRSSFSLTRLGASASASRKSRLIFTRHKTRRENRGFFPAWRPNSARWMAFWLIYKADAQPCLAQSKNCEAEQRVRSSSSLRHLRHEHPLPLRFGNRIPPPPCTTSSTYLCERDKPFNLPNGSTRQLDRPDRLNAKRGGACLPLILLRHNLFYPLVLRSVAERDASRRIEATAGPSWFSERCEASSGDGALRQILCGDGANARLLTMRI
jgi:hypothetical protein